MTSGELASAAAATTMNVRVVRSFISSACSIAFTDRLSVSAKKGLLRGSASGVRRPRIVTCSCAATVRPARGPRRGRSRMSPSRSTREEARRSSAGAEPLRFGRSNLGRRSFCRRQEPASAPSAVRLPVGDDDESPTDRARPRRAGGSRRGGIVVRPLARGAARASSSSRVDRGRRVGWSRIRTSGSPSNAAATSLVAARSPSGSPSPAGRLRRSAQRWTGPRRHAAWDAGLERREREGGRVLFGSGERRRPGVWHQLGRLAG